MTDTKAYCVNNFLMVFMLGISLNFALVCAGQRSANAHITPSKELLQIIALNSKKGKKSAKNSGMIRRMCAATKNILQAPVNLVFGKKPSRAKKTFYALLSMSILASIGYGCYEYWPMIEALWKEQNDVSKEGIISEPKNSLDGSQRLHNEVNGLESESEKVVADNAIGLDEKKKAVDRAKEATNKQHEAQKKENVPGVVINDQPKVPQQSTQAPLPQQHDNKAAMANEQIIQTNYEKLKEYIEWVCNKVGNFIEWGTARKSESADQSSQSQDLQVQVQNKKIDSSKQQNQQTEIKPKLVVPVELSRVEQEKANTNGSSGIEKAEQTAVSIPAQKVDQVIDVKTKLQQDLNKKENRMRELRRTYDGTDEETLEYNSLSDKVFELRKRIQELTES